MAAESGRKVGIGIGLETTRGTGVAPTYWVEREEGDFQERAGKESVETGLGVLDRVSASDVVKQSGGGTVKGHVGADSFGAWLSLAFGAKPTTSANADASGSVYDHTFAQSQSNESLTGTIALKDSNRDERYPLASPSSLEIEVAAGTPRVRWTGELVSKKPASGAGNTVAYATESYFKPKHVSVKLAANEAGLSGASAIPVSSIKASITRKLNEYQAIGSTDLNNIFTEEVDFKGDFSLLFDSVTHRNNYLSDGYQAMQIIMTDTDTTIGTAANPTLTITFAGVAFDDWGLDQNLSNMIEQTLGFMPLYQRSAGKTWSAVLTNTVTSY